LVDNELVHPIGAKIRLLFRCEFEYLAGGAHPIENLLVGDSRLAHGHYLVHRHESVPVEIGGSCTQGCLRRCRMGLGIPYRGFRAAGVAAHNSVFIGTNQVPSTRAHSTAQKCSKQSVMFPTDEGTGRCTPNPSDRCSLSAGTPWQILATSCRGQ
jgi:hypothetical protein